MLLIKKTLAGKCFEHFFAIAFYRVIFLTSFADEKYSGTSAPTCPNGSNIEDAAVTSVHRCTL